MILSYFLPYSFSLLTSFFPTVLPNSFFFSALCFLFSASRFLFFALCFLFSVFFSLPCLILSLSFAYSFSFFATCFLFLPFSFPPVLSVWQLLSEYFNVISFHFVDLLKKNGSFLRSVFSCDLQGPLNKAGF